MVVLRMSPWGAWVDGWRRVQRAPALVVGGWLATVAVALPLTLALHDQIAGHLGDSLAAADAASGVNADWWNEFLSQAGDLGRTFVPSIIGGAAVLRNLSGLASQQALPLVVLAAVAVHLGLTLFLTGGILDRLARDRAVGAYGFFAACGLYAFRLLRLLVITGAAYAALLLWLHPVLNRVYDRLSHDLTVERTAFLYRLGVYAVFGLLVLVVNLIADYAKIRMVVEDRRSAIGAVAAAIRFIRRQPAAAVGLYLLNATGFVVVMGLYVALAPGAGGGAAALVALVVAQVYLVMRLAARLVFAASQIALFQSRLAHAGYTAAPLPVWPDSPAAEAVRPE